METAESNICVIIAPIITAAIAAMGSSLSAALVAWIHTRSSNKSTKEEHERLLRQAEAEDLDKIIYPAINTLEINKFIEKPN